jgi:hypothetical protein
MDSSRALPPEKAEPTAREVVPPVKAVIRIRKLDKIETTGAKATGNSNS